MPPDRGEIKAPLAAFAEKGNDIGDNVCPISAQMQGGNKFFGSAEQDCLGDQVLEVGLVDRLGPPGQ